MPIPSLAQIAGKKIPINALFFATEQEGNVINQVFLNQVRIHPWFGLNPPVHASWRNVCKVCKQDGDCLCYLFQIRHMMMDRCWNTEEDYRYLEDWLNPIN